MQRCRARVDCGYLRRLDSTKAREISLELRDTRPGSQPPRAHAGLDFGDLCFTYMRGAENEKWGFEFQSWVRMLEKKWA
jgi:hypothetical protein